MARKRDKLYYMKQCKKALQEIALLGPSDGFHFLKLKKKAVKYLEKAKELEAAEIK